MAATIDIEQPLALQAYLRRTGRIGAREEPLIQPLGGGVSNRVMLVQRPNGEPVRLTPLEARLLERLMLHAGQVLPSDSLITAVWGNEGGDKTMLKQLVYRLRSKMMPDGTDHPESASPIETIPGVGYSLTEK